MKRWNPGRLDEIARTVHQRIQVLIHSGDDFGKVFPVEGWAGPASDNAASAHKALMSKAEKMAAGVSVVAKAIGQASDAIPAVQHAITNAEELARKYGYTVDDNGGVADTFAGKEPPPDMHPQDRARAHQQIADDLAQALRTADDIDNDLTAVLQHAEHGEFGTGDEATVAAAAEAALASPGLTLPEPPPNATPAQNAAWWATLSPAGRAILLRDRPAAIGAMDGLPAEDRDKANRAVFQQQRDNLKHQRDEIQHKLDGMRESDPRQMDDYHDLEKQRDALDDKLKGMNQINDRLNRPLPGQPPAFLLGLNPANSGQAIIAVGNPDHAQNVATYVPGTTSGLNDGMVKDISRADVMMQAAQKVNPVPTSVVMWAGYDAPQSVFPDAASTSFADRAEPGLRRFQDGLDAAHAPGPTNTTVIGHSYGTTVVGQTARDMGLPADNVVMVASPGVGVQHANELRLDGVAQDQVGQHVYSTKSAVDPVPAFTNFGNPMADAIDPLGPDPTTGWFGGQRFESNANAGHSDYWEYESKSLRGMASIIAGGRPGS
ncbi:alpha/beta hydrolase [Amycolatopsis sp. NPDC059021]|uniref:alpha/beta hydrolase n=1 Tax=Amycolatopsis sp. NPDC059021 TaxID=3346704 RepID=UPI00366FE782